MSPVPPLGEAVPRWGNAGSRLVGRLGLALCRFRIGGAMPDVSRCVMIVAPHTSNWDFVVGLMAKLALGLGARFLAKHTLFRGPFGGFLRWIGGIPVDRDAAGGVVGEAVAEFRRRDKLVLVITPEGTRRKVAAWKSGFYRIAEAAGVPIVPVAFDYSAREVVLGSLFPLTGEYEADLEALRSRFRPEMALRPENY